MSQTSLTFITLAVCLGPAGLAGFAGFLTLSGIQNNLRTAWWKFAVSVLILAGLVYWVFAWSNSGGLGAIFASWLALSSSMVTMISAVLLIWKLKKWRKLVGLALGLTYPLVAFMAISKGDEYSPDSITERNRNAIVIAIGRYHADYGLYPARLNDLVPDYLSRIPEKMITTNTDWQYKASGTRYDFGYLEYPDSLNSSWVCSYSSDKPKWYCASGNFKPFGEIPTP